MMEEGWYWSTRILGIVVADLVSLQRHESYIMEARLGEAEAGDS